MLDINLLIQGNFGTGSTKHLKTTFSLISYLNRLLVVRFFLEGLIGFLSLGLFINMNVISNNGNSFVGTNRKYKDIFLSVLGATYLKDFQTFSIILQLSQSNHLRIYVEELPQELQEQFWEVFL